METAEFSSLLLGLYKAAATTPVKSFRQLAIEAVRRYVPFDAALWTTTHIAGGAPTRFVWMLDGASEALIPLLNDFAGNDQLTLSLLMERPGRTLVFRPEDLPDDTLSRAITALSGMRHVAATAIFEERLGLHHILTLGRRRTEQPFSPEEQALKELLMPHLEAMVARNFEAQFLAAMAGEAADSMGSAMASDSGVLLTAQPNFIRLMREEWPDWSGPALPAPLIQTVQAGRRVATGAHINLHLSRRMGSVLVIANRHSALDRLTQKEYLVAADFADGMSYKEVARLHGISPETVRSRLRTVYEKLGVGDKSELSRHFSQSRVLANLQTLLSQ